MVTKKLIDEIINPIKESEYSSIAFSPINNELILSRIFFGRGDLHVFSIGVSETLDTSYRYNWNSCKNDAFEFSNILCKASIGLYENIHTYILTDSLATMKNIAVVFKRLLSQVDELDDLSFFYSGDTYYYDDTLKKSVEYFLSSYDTPGSLIDNPSWKHSCLSDTLLSFYLNNLRSNNKIIIIDAPSSEVLFEKLNSLMIDPYSLKSSRGTEISYGSTDGLCLIGLKKGIQSLETPDKKHGVLTSFVLKGIGGEADIGCPGNKKINNIELRTYMDLQQSYGIYEGSAWTKGMPREGHIVPFLIITNNLFNLGYVRKNKFVDLDLIPPKIEIVSPDISKDTITKEKEIVFRLKANDDKALYSITINGKDMQNTDADNFRYSLLLAFGNNKVEIIATDLSQNITTKKFNIYREELNRQPINYGLFIATNTYDDSFKWGKLRNPINDAQEVASILNSKYGFDTTIICNPTLAEIETSLKSSITRKYQDNDQLLVFFAGHGFFDKITQEGFIVAKDSKGDQNSTYLSYSNLNALLSRHPCKHIFLIIDVCHGGTFFPAVAMRGTDINELDDKYVDMYEINKKLENKSRIVITSAGKESVSDGIDHSPFVSLLLDELKQNEKPMMTYIDLVRAVQHLAPQPVWGGFTGQDIEGNFIFIKK